MVVPIQNTFYGATPDTLLTLHCLLLHEHWKLPTLLVSGQLAED
jgi:hypothetical protein